ncbi:hypothetical protein N9M79_04670 [Alphaproteobacteria bacterium]|nr:hypothetical protein [Alphaproteobacteria bacterium]
MHLAPGQNAFNVVGLPDKPGIDAAAHLLEVVNHLRGASLLPPPQARPAPRPKTLPDLAGREALADKDIATALVWRGH